MSGISEPQVTLSIIPAKQLAGVQEQKVLIVGQMLAAGTATSGALIQAHPNDSSEDTLFGQRSHIAGMVREFKKLNKQSRLDILPLNDGGAATKATSVVTVTGTATATGTVILKVGSAKNHVYAIGITNADTATNVGDAIVTAITADADAPFTAVNVTGTVTITASNGGTLADEWDIKLDGAVAGTSIALTGWAGGATDPTLTGILSVIANVRYQTILWASVYPITEVQTELDARFNITNNVKDGVAIQVKRGTLATLTSYVSAFNSQSIVVVNNKNVSLTAHKGSAIIEMPDIIGAQIAAIRALRLTQDAPLTQFQTTTSSRDQFGGIGIASLPYHNTLLPNLEVDDITNFYSDTDVNSFKGVGIASIGPNRANNSIIFGDMVTTYLTDAGANTDTSYKYLNTVDTASVIREFFFTNYKSRYAQTRLTEGDLIAGKDMVNEGSFRAFSNSLYDSLSDEGLVQAGTSAKKDFNDNLTITVDIANGKITVAMAPLLVTQLRVVIGTIQINFGS